LSILNLDFNLSISLKDLEYLYQYEFIPKIWFPIYIFVNLINLI
jgi:hypothetical protein